MNLNEIWKPVAGYEGLYEVSNNNGFRALNGKTYKCTIRNGYRRICCLKKDFHIIVAQAFPEICGEWFEGAVVHHKNHDRLDNRPENLIVLSPSEHSKIHYESQPDSFKKASAKRSKSISNALKGHISKRRVPVIQLTKSGEFVKKWDSISQVIECGFSAGNVCSACKGQLKTAYGFVWQYAVSD